MSWETNHLAKKIRGWKYLTKDTDTRSNEGRLVDVHMQALCVVAFHDRIVSPSADPILWIHWRPRLK